MKLVGSRFTLVDYVMDAPPSCKHVIGDQLTVTAVRIFFGTHQTDCFGFVRFNFIFQTSECPLAFAGIEVIGHALKPLGQGRVTAVFSRFSSPT